MGKINKIQLTRYVPFDIPENDSEMIHGKNSVHIGMSAFTSVVRGKIEWFVDAEFDKLVELVAGRGAERGKNYIITMHKDEASVLPIVALHTTHDFISQEDV